MEQKTNKKNRIQEQQFLKKLKPSQLRDQFSIERNKKLTKKNKTLINSFSDQDKKN